MSRNSSGTYALPAGNPVVTGTPITIAWANGTLDDIATALTDSLSRSGDGGMTAPLELADGAVALPGLSFVLEPSTGFYRASAGNLVASILGSAVMAISSTGVAITGAFVPSGVVSAPVGSAALPSHTFTGDLNTGMSAATADTLVLSTAGTARLTISSAGATFAPVILSSLGTAALPGYSFTGDTNTGMSAQTADTLVLSTAGTARLTLSTTHLTSVGAFASAPGTAALPTYSFTGDPNTGMSAETNDTLILSTGGTARLTISTVLTSAVNWRGPDGSESAPAITFSGDTNTGFWSTVADTLMFSEGGTGYRIGFRAIPQRILNTTGDTVLADVGKHIYKASGGSGETITIDGSLAYAEGDAITFINQGGGTLTIAISTDTMTMAVTGDTGSRTLADDGIATAIKVGATSWFISGSGLS